MKALVGLFALLIGTQAQAVDYICSTPEPAEGASTVYLTAKENGGYNVSIFYPYDKPQDEGVCYQDDVRGHTKYTCAMQTPTLEVKFEKYEFDENNGYRGIARLNEYSADGELEGSSLLECEATPEPCEGSPAAPAFTKR